MSDQIDPAFKSAWRESQGQPVDSAVLNRRAAAPQEPAPEPVAWLIGGETWTRDKAKADDCRVRGFTVEPLYASPQPANPEQVTDAMVETAVRAYDNGQPFEASVCDYGRMRAALTAVLGAGGQAVADPIGIVEKSGGIRWFNPPVPIGTKLYAHPADERVVEALTKEDLAEALSCFWNAAIGDAHDKQDSTAFAVICSMAEGIAAVERRLHELSAQEGRKNG